MQEERIQLGEFWLDQRDGSPYWYICWNTPGPKGERGRTQRRSTGERDLGDAQKCLAEHFLKHTTLEQQPPSSITIAFVLDQDYEKYGQKLASHDTVKSAIAKWKEFWGQDTIDALRSADRQREFIRWLSSRTAKNTRGEPISPSTVRRQLNVGRKALAGAAKRHEVVGIPYVMTYAEYTEGRDSGDAVRERTYTLEQMAALFNAAAGTEHLWRYMLLMVGFALRSNAPLAIRVSMIDFQHQRVNLLPPGTRQTKKRRPTLPICATLLPWLRIWAEKENRVYTARYGRRRGQTILLDHLVTWRGTPLKSIRSGFETILERAGMQDDEEAIAYVIRHTIATWMAEQGVPDRELEIWMGHKLPGNKTTRRYIHLRPEYLKNAAAAVDAYFKQLAPLVKRPILRASCAPVAIGAPGRDTA